MDLPVASAVSKYIPTSWQANPHVWCLQLQFHRVLCLKYSNIIPIKSYPHSLLLEIHGNSWNSPKKTCLSLFVPRYAKVSLTKCRGHVDFADVHQNTGAHGDPAQISGLSVEPLVPSGYD